MRTIATRRSGTVRAAIDEVWRVIADPYRLPAWWPRTARVEGVNKRGWTSVMTTERGRALRADYTITALQKPDRYAWELQLEGSPFAKHFSLLRYELTLARAGDTATTITIELRQGLRGWSLFGSTLVRRAAKRQLDEAIAELRELLEPA